MQIVRGIVLGAWLVGACGSDRKPLPAGAQWTGATATGSAGLKPTTSAGFKAGPEGFPIPDDADAGERMPVGNGGPGYNVGYRVPRDKDAVFAQLRPELEKQGFVVANYIPSKRSHRLIMAKAGKNFVASVSEEGATSTLFITVGGDVGSVTPGVSSP